jgi:hypothetical protein
VFKDLHNQQALAIGKTSQVGIELGADLNIDLLDPPGSTAGAAVDVPSGSWGVGGGREPGSS